MVEITLQFGYYLENDTDSSLAMILPAIGISGSSIHGLQKSGPMEDYALADLYSWLGAHSGLSHPYFGTPSSTVMANESSSSIRRY